MNAEIRRSVAERLRSERTRLDLSQADMATAGGISLRTQAAWEKGEQSPNADYLATVSVIGVDVLFIVTGTYQLAGAQDAQPQLSADEQSLLMSFRGLNDKARSTIKELALMLAGNGD
jgi:transcriptional regulator with XRE-family HTH domain